MVLITGFGFAQKKDFEWVEKTNGDQGSAPTVTSTAMVVKSNGDMYLAGSNGLLGGGITYGQPCLAKYGSDGGLTWVKYFPDGNNSGTGTSFMTEDSNGDLIALYYGSELDFDGTPTPVSPKYVVVKFDTAGTVQWVNYFGGNQMNVRDLEVSEDGNVALIIDAQFVTTVDTTVTPGNRDVILLLDGSDGAVSLIDIAGYTPTTGAHGLNNMYPYDGNTMVCITTDVTNFTPIKTFISVLNLDDNTLTSIDTVENIFTTATLSGQHGAVLNILDYDVATKTAYVSGRASMTGASVGTDSIFGVNPNNQSMYIAKMDFNTGDILNKVVYYTPGVQEGVQRAVKMDDQITFFLTYRDTLRNTNSGDVFTSIDTLPNNGPHPHTIIQNFDLDLNLNYYNQVVKLGGTSYCNGAGYGDNGALYMLYWGGSDRYFDNYFLDANERSIIAKMGGTPVGVSEIGEDSSVRLYPNPANNELNIVSNSAVSLVHIIDMKGQLIKRVVPQNGSIDVSNLDAGVYLVQTIGEDFNSMTKVVIQH